MKKLYYKIMISSIYTAQHNGFMSDIWKFASGFYFAFATSIYLLFFYLFLNNYMLNDKLDFFVLHILSEKKYNFILNIFIYFIAPIMVLHYSIFLADNKYKALIKEYKAQYNKRTFGWYFALAIVILFANLFLKKN